MRPFTIAISRTMLFASLFGVTIALVPASPISALANRPVQHEKHEKIESISGRWSVSFAVQGNTVQGTLDMKVDGQRVTGIMYTDHTGEGTLKDGRWADGELSFTADFAAHESIAVTGRFQEGKLVGEFTTEGMKGEWKGTKDSNVPSSQD